MKLKRIVVETAVIGIALALTGCTQGNAKTADDIRLTSAAPTTSAPAAPVTTAAPTPTPTVPSSYKFGETVKWEKGVELTVAALRVLVDWASTLPEIKRLELYVEPWNEGSWRTAVPHGSPTTRRT
jgi:PBP1b-binding outer membrane lipoprotein LpoB